MRDFRCPKCDQHLAFENSVCLKCGSAVGYWVEEATMVVIGDAGGGADRRDGFVDPDRYRLCANMHIARCNWLVAVERDGGGEVPLCASCELTRTRPGRDDKKAYASFADAEGAKRRLVAELVELALPIVGRDEDPDFGLAFDLLSSRDDNVITGHANGVITLDLAEGDDVHREQLRIEMAEPYRTLLGHFRHETGHYYYFRLIGASQSYLPRFHELFGDPDADYQAALDRHYRDGAPAGWEDRHVSSYATMHPAEDWAETFAHYLHIRDTLDTAAAFGLAPAAASLQARGAGAPGFDAIIAMWLPLAWSLNMVNRSMGHDDLYPFVLPPAVLEKMRFIHTVITEVTSDPDKLAIVAGTAQPAG